MTAEKDHAWAKDLLAEYLAGGLTVETRARLDAHIETCDSCSAEVEELSEYDLTVDGPPPSLRERLLESIRSYRPGPAARALIGGALVVLLGIIGLVIVETEPGGLLAEEKLIAVDSGAIEATHGNLKAPTPHEVERPRDRLERKGIPKDDSIAQPSSEPAIFFPESKDHNESADNEDFRLMKGDSKDFLSYIKGEAGGFRGRQAGKNPGVYDTMGVGVGGGGGGRYGGRFGGRENLVVRGGGGALVTAPSQPSRSGEMVETTNTGKVFVMNALEELARQNQEEQARANRRIIRSGDMEFEIESFDNAVAILMKITLEEQGFIATVNSEKLQNGKVRGVVVLRVPPDHLDTLLLKLRALGDLKSQKIGSQDVTKHYTDLESRLRAARTMEERLINIIKEGKGLIKDLLQAEKELGEWRTKIETMVGEINYYNNLIAHSTLTISLYEKEIRAPFAVVETERVDMAVEVDDVEKAHRDALAAVAEAKGRVTRSDLKQLNTDQFQSTIQFEVAPDRAGALRDRLKLMGILARLDINRVQENQGGPGKPQEIKVQQNDTQVTLSLYNLSNLVPRETIHLRLASTDAEKSFKAILDRVEKAAGRVQSSHLTRQKNDQTTGSILFQVRAADADAVLADLRALGEVLKLESLESTDNAGTTRAKRGFDVHLFGLGSVQPRETSTLVLATRDVAAGYRALLDAAKTADARILNAQINENDRRNITATVSVELRREHEKAMADAMDKVGNVYTRNTVRAQDAENVVDSKTQIQFRLFDAASIPARETVTLAVEVGDVELAAKGLESDFKERVVDARHTRHTSGRRESVISIDVPLKEMKAAIERVRSLGTLGEQLATKNPAVPENELALARLEIRISNEILVASDSGPWANIRKGLAFSLQAASWSLMLIMVGVCFVLPLVLMVWTVVRILRKLRPKAVPVAPAA